SASESKHGGRGEEESIIIFKVPNKGEILGPGGPLVLYSPPSHIGNHEMSSAGPRVHGDDQYVPLNKGLVPPSTPNPTTHGP
ncbi:hypothetical protein SO802_013796, partial [Lithocarpus litseifolius]